MAADSVRFLAKVLECIAEADRDGPLAGTGEEMPDGLSGAKTVGALQRLGGLFAGDPGACYLEIGVFQGLTLAAVAAGHPGLACFGIDNFSQFDPDGENLGLVRRRLEHLGVANAQLINLDFEDALAGLEETLDGRRIGLYFIDGPHDYRSQLIALMLAVPHLGQRAVIVVDDANYAFVRQSTRDFLLTHSDFKLAFEAYSPAHISNIPDAERRHWIDGWLNGVNILVRDGDGLLGDMVPTCEPSRTLYVNEWMVHRHQMAELAPEAVRLAQAVCLGDGGLEAPRREDLLERFSEMREVLDGRYADRNTYSENLPESRFNRLND